MQLNKLEEYLNKILFLLEKTETTVDTLARKNYYLALNGGYIRCLLMHPNNIESIAGVAEEKPAIIHYFFEYPKLDPFNFWSKNSNDFIFDETFFYKFVRGANGDFNFTYRTAKLECEIAEKMKAILNEITKDSHQRSKPSDEAQALIRKIQKLISSYYYIFVNNTYNYANRLHFYHVAYKDKVGDAAKMAILDEFSEELNTIVSDNELDRFKDKLKKDERYQILKTSQGITTKFFQKNTTSEIVLQNMIEQKATHLKYIKDNILGKK